MTLIQKFEHYIKLATHRKKYKPEDREALVLLEEQLRVALDPEVLLEHRVGATYALHSEWQQPDQHLKIMYFDGDDYVRFVWSPPDHMFQSLPIQISTLKYIAGEFDE